MGIQKMKSLMALSLATVFAFGCSKAADKAAETKNMSADEYFEAAEGKTDFSSKGAGNAGWGGSMEEMKQAAMMAAGGGGGGGDSMEAMREAAMLANSGGGRGGAGATQQRMSPKERAIQKAKALQKETQDVVEKFLAAVDDADQKKMSSMIGRRARGPLKRLRDGNISDKDFDRIVDMYQDGQVGDSKKSRRVWTVTVDLPGRSRRIKVKEEANNWKITGLEGLR